jgi:hypothetical protein
MPMRKRFQLIVTVAAVGLLQSGCTGPGPQEMHVAVVTEEPPGTDGSYVVAAAADVAVRLGIELSDGVVIVEARCIDGAAEQLEIPPERLVVAVMSDDAAVVEQWAKTLQSLRMQPRATTVRC